MRQIRATSTVIREKMDLIFGKLKAKLDGQIVIKAYAREPEEIADFAAQLDDAHVPRVKESKLGAAFANISGAIGGVGTALVFAVGAYEVLQGRMTPGPGRLDGGPGGDGLRPGGAAGRPGLRLRADGRQRGPAGRDPRPGAGRPGARRRRSAGPWAGPAGRSEGAVEFDRVGFGYLPGEPVVWDIRLKVRPGMKVALVGPTGCGKSTLVNLLMRFYDADLGRDPARRRADPAASPRGRCGGRSAWSCKTRSSSGSAWRTTSATATPRPPTSRSRRPHARRWCTTSPWPCRKATRRSWAREDTSSARESGSGWRSPGPSAPTRPWWCSTRPPARWTPPARP